MDYGHEGPEEVEDNDEAVARSIAEHERDLHDNYEAITGRDF